jgi:hypothetical protein
LLAGHDGRGQRIGRAFDGADAAGPTLSIGARSGIYVVLCLPGTHGNNRFGPDPIPDRPPRESSHPALVKEMDEELGRMVADRRKEEFQDYYRARVLPAIERTKSARRV